MLNKLKKFFSHSVSVDNLGLSLADLLLEGSDKTIYSLSNRTDLSKGEIAQILVSIYLLAYRLVIRKGSFYLNNLILNDIFSSFRDHIVRIIAKEDFMLQVESLQIKAGKNMEEYLQLYSDGVKQGIERVIEYICKDINADKDSSIYIILQELLLNSITLIQDYLVDLSTKRIIIK